MDEVRYAQRIRKLTQFWAWTVPALFLVLALLGLGMRLGQGGVVDAQPDLFYAVMTLHGLGMAGTAFVGGFAAVVYLLARYVRISLAVGWTMYLLTVIGVAGLVIASLFGRFGPGWYLLYPMPFFANGVWPDWALGLAIVSLIVLGLAWLLGQMDLFRALVAKYGIADTFAWNHLIKSRAQKAEIPPIVLIVAAACLVPGILTTLDGAVLLMLYLFKQFIPALALDPLLLKNMTFLWGHTLVNLTMYLGLALVYELLPKFTGKPWKTNAVIAISWNTVMVLVLLAFFHHLYMDFVQPNALQYVGQIASYLSAIPATAVTVFGVISQVYRSGLQWRFAPLSFFLGIIGWVIGGFAAVVDSTIRVNFIFHNTMWVPAHFHTYFLVGYFLILWGFLYNFSEARREQIAKTGLWLFVIGSYGFLSMFYLGGAVGVPRRFASYGLIPIASLASWGQKTAIIASAFVALLLVGAVMIFGVIYGGLLKSPSTESSEAGTAISGI